MKLFNKRNLKILSALLLFSCTFSIFYFSKIASYYFEIPVDLQTSITSARIQVSIESHNFQLDLDSGAKYCSLYPHHLDKLNKKFLKFNSSLDIHGNEYKDSLYTVSHFKIGDSYSSEIPIIQESPQFMMQGILALGENKTKEEEIYKCDGRAGRDVFRGKNFLLDFARSKIIFCKNLRDLTRDHYKTDKFVQIPVALNKFGICFQVETDEGPKTLILDTGASHTFLRASTSEITAIKEANNGLPFWPSKKFVLNGHDFGITNFYLYPISTKLDGLDGMIGLDFLKSYAVYIDLKKSMAYIGKASDVLDR